MRRAAIVQCCGRAVGGEVALRLDEKSRTGESSGGLGTRETSCQERAGRAVSRIRKAVRCWPSAFSTGFCHAAAGAAVHLRAMPVLKAFTLEPHARQTRQLAQLAAT